MGEVIIVTGKTGSGKTRWAEVWVAADPKNRRLVKNLAAGIAAIKEGRDVVMDLEVISQQDVRVVTFGA